MRRGCRVELTVTRQEIPDHIPYNGTAIHTDANDDAANACTPKCPKNALSIAVKPMRTKLAKLTWKAMDTSSRISCLRLKPSSPVMMNGVSSACFDMLQYS